METESFEEIEKIESYLENKMTQQEREDFEKSMNENQDLLQSVNTFKLILTQLDSDGKEQFNSIITETDERLDQIGFFSSEFEKEIIGGLENIGKEEFGQTLKNVDKDFAIKLQSEKKKETKVISINRFRYISLAASFLLAVTAAWYLWPKPMNHDSLFNTHFAALSDQISEDVSYEINELGFSDAGLDDLQALDNSMKEYNQGAYNAFINSSGSLLEKKSLKHYEEKLVIHRVIAYMELGNYEQALKDVRGIKSSDQSKWYESLILLKLGRVKEAKSVLQTINSEEIIDVNSLNSLMKNLN